jgi:6-pyruvoyltetrahydropterin/6-carboxytetrahydropterin synthase
MFAIEVQTVFCAAHALRLENGETEPTHGHNFCVTVHLTCQKLDRMQTVVDFHHVERLLGQVVAPWTNQNLNLIEPFRARINPSAERIAEQIGLQLQGFLTALPDAPVVTRGLRIVEVRITEAPDCLAIWQP